MMNRDDSFKQFIFGDTVISREPLSADEVGKLLLKGKELKEKGGAPSQDEIMAVFSRLSAAWADPMYQKRRQALDVLTRTSDLGVEFIKVVLEEFAKIIAPSYLLDKIEGELGSADIQGKLDPQRQDVRYIIQPSGQVLHVASGNVFLAGIESLVSGIITRNINFLKMSTDDREFPVIFAESIREFDKEKVITPRLAVLWWHGGDEAIEGLFKQNMDRIVFWGGTEALQNWERNLAESAVLVRHGPKISFGIVSKAGLADAELSGLTDNIAMDIAIWEQRACNCPQMIFVEKSVSDNEMKNFIDSLSGSLQKMHNMFPPTSRSDDEYVEILKTRELAMAGHLVTGKPVSVIGPKTLDWTIIFEKESGIGEVELSPLNRTILIKRYSSLKALIELLNEHSSYLQTVGCCLDKTEIPEYAIKLSSMGVTRLCPFGVMAIPTAGTPHDGSFALRDLTRFTVVEC